MARTFEGKEKWLRILDWIYFALVRTILYTAGPHGPKIKA
jgi:hypothetical protein